MAVLPDEALTEIYSKSISVCCQNSPCRLYPNNLFKPFLLKGFFHFCILYSLVLTFLQSSLLVKFVCFFMSCTRDQTNFYSTLVFMTSRCRNTIGWKNVRLFKFIQLDKSIFGRFEIDLKHTSLHISKNRFLFLFAMPKKIKNKIGTCLQNR